VITCPKCTKENQDHYKFCLGCGAELPRDASPKKFAAGTPPHGVRAVPQPIADEPTNLGNPAPGLAPAKAPEPYIPPLMTPQGPPPAAPPPVAPPVAAPPAAAAVGGATFVCPQCEHVNPPNNKFCASCGFKIGKPPVVGSDGPIAPVAAPAPAIPAPLGSSPQTGPAVVLTALRADGSEAGTYTLPPGNVTVGRDTGVIFAGDSYLSPRHATFYPRNGKILVRDESSLNGVYRKLRRDDPVRIGPNDVFRVGQEILRFEPMPAVQPSADGVERLGSPSKGYIGRIALVVGRDATGNAYPIPETGLHLGRERGDVLFPEDGYVSGLHCRLAWQNGSLFLTDLGSSNGSFVRLSGDTEMVNGDILLMGQQLFRVNF
jgi:hypothetical protein